MLLHIIPYDKYGKRFIEFNEKKIRDLDMIYFITYVQKGFELSENKSIVLSKGHKLASSIQLLYLILKAKKIFHHGLFVPSHNILLAFLIPYINKKYHWIIWGGDLYYFLEDKNSNLLARVNEIFRKRLLKKIKLIITPINGDFNKLTKWYSNRGKQISIIPYTYFLEDHFTKNRKNTNLNDKKKILIGNSATRSNNHIQLFYKIFFEIDFYNYDIIVPLSYGDANYRDEVIQKGFELFNDSFVPIREFMDYNLYNLLLSSIDFAFFYNDRQQALGNIVPLLSKSIPIYIKRINPLWDFLKVNGFFIIDADEKIDFTYTREIRELLEINSIKCKNLFGSENVARGWKNLYY